MKRLLTLFISIVLGCVSFAGCRQTEYYLEYSDNYSIDYSNYTYSKTYLKTYPKVDEIVGVYDVSSTGLDNVSHKVHVTKFEDKYIMEIHQSSVVYRTSINAEYASKIEMIYTETNGEYTQSYIEKNGAQLFEARFWYNENNELCIKITHTYSVDGKNYYTDLNANGKKVE